MRGRRRRVGAQRRSRIPPSTPTAPIAKHRRRDAQFPCDLRQRPTAARQQGYCLPLELIGKLTTSLAHSTPSRSSSELSKGVHQFAGSSHLITLAPMFLHACSDRREIIGGAGLAHAWSVPLAAQFLRTCSDCREIIGSAGSA